MARGFSWLEEPLFVSFLGTGPKCRTVHKDCWSCSECNPVLPLSSVTTKKELRPRYHWITFQENRQNCLSVTNLDSVLKSRDITLLTKVCIVKVMVFSSSHVQMWELDDKEGWAPKNWCFQTMVLKKTLASPLVNKKIKPVNPKGNQPRLFTGRTDAETGAPTLWPPDAESWLLEKILMLEKTEARRRRKQQRRSRVVSPQWTWVRANPRDGEGQGAWRAAVHGVTESRTRPSNWTTDRTDPARNQNPHHQRQARMQSKPVLRPLSLTTLQLCHRPPRLPSAVSRSSSCSLGASCCTVLLYFSRCCTVKLKMFSSLCLFF